jgi:hypothetical protein
MIPRKYLHFRLGLKTIDFPTLYNLRRWDGVNTPRDEKHWFVSVIKKV